MPILPFWSLKGRSLGLYCVHEDQEKSAIIVILQLEGEGLVLYKSSILDPIQASAFSASAHYIAFNWRQSPSDGYREGPAKFVFMDVHRETFFALSEADEFTGTSQFFTDTPLTSTVIRRRINSLSMNLRESWTV